MLSREEITYWLREDDAERLSTLWHRADRVRRENVGDEVHLRGLLEISNHCRRRCGYCGLRGPNTGLKRYRMSVDQIMSAVGKIVSFGYGTVVMQAGEDPGISEGMLTEVVRRIKSETDLAVTLSMGERPDEELAAWHEAGADRYLLRFETSNPALYERIHPSLPKVTSDRIALLGRLRDMGYELGSGVMIGIPGQRWDDLARDIELFGELDLDMIGVGPFIANADTPLGRADASVGGEGQVPATELMVYKVIALARLVCPRSNIPSTTALATLNTASGRELGLERGANVVMPNVTPAEYRVLYTIYPGKACLTEVAEQCNACMRRRIASIGRRVGAGRGDSPNYRPRTASGRL